MPRIDQETVQKILDAADIVEVVSDFVKLRRSGANYKGLCPFHSERTPSFSVNRARNICKCFSCGKGGSPVNFIMEHEQMTFNEALRYLARKYNIEIVEKELSDEERQAASRRESLLALNSFANEHFRTNLTETVEGKSVALPYFRHRGLSDAMVERFQLGYAIDKPTELLDAARRKGFREEFMVELGLIVQNERDGRSSLYDRYRSRVIFPIHSLSGRVVGFGARTMRSDKNIAKYVNSPESSIYSKKKELYGLFQARSAIVRADKCIMVEGYLDVISMHQAGVENVVASSGTSITEEQIRVVHRFTENVTLIYDADAAGIKASLRGINMLLAEKMNVKVLALPPGDDPDSFAQNHSSEEVFAYLAENEVDIITFMVGKLMAGVSANDPTAKAKVVNDVLRTVAYVDEPVKRQEYISQCSRMLDVPEDVLVNQLNIFITGRYEEAEKAARRDEARRTISDIEEEEKKSENKTEKDDDAPLLNLDNNYLKPFEEELIRYIVRYGLLYMFDMTEGDEVVPGTVFDLIETEMKMDGVAFSYGPYTKLMDVFRQIRFNEWPAERERKLAELESECRSMLEEKRDAIRSNAGTMQQLEKAETKAQEEIEEYRVNVMNEFDMRYGQTRLVNSDDNDVRRIATELLVERYTLSRIYSRQGKIETEQDQLRNLVPRAVFELRNAIVAGMIKDLNKQLMNLTDADSDKAGEILSNIAQYKAFQKKLGKMLGERIIMPSIR